MTKKETLKKICWLIVLEIMYVGVAAGFSFMDLYGLQYFTKFMGISICLHLSGAFLELKDLKKSGGLPSIKEEDL